MLKFFRKIRQQLLTENRFSKYLIYAIGEIFLVVIGILIALQINNWNENRKDSMKEAAVLSNLHKDFEQTKMALTKSLNIYPENIGRLKSTLKYLGMGATQLSDAMKDTIFNTVYRSTAVVEGTLNSILNTDKLELITNDSLKQLLTAYPAEINKFKSQEANVKRIVLEIHRPILESYLTLGEYATIDDEVNNFVPSDFTGLLKDQQYQNALVDRLLQSRSLVLRAERFLERTNMIIELIEDEIKK